MVPLISLLQFNSQLIKTDISYYDVFLVKTEDKGQWKMKVHAYITTSDYLFIHISDK
jgi:hypothetical protein